MVTQIANAFRSSATFSKHNEVELFRAFAKAIVKHSKSTFIDETHGGNVCNVSFVSATNKTETCEIADLLIISSHAQSNNLRATFWQVKKQAVSKWINVTTSGTQLDFKGQFNQWDLLSRRPAVNGTGTFNPPRDLLSCFTSPSIGSFGIFFERNLKIELAHSTAEFISCPSPNAKHPTLSINGYFDRYHFGASEIVTRSDLASFLRSLFNFEVGALLRPDIPQHQWLIGKVRSKATEQLGADLQILDTFIKEGNQRVPDDPSGFNGLSVLIVGKLNEA